jgi:transcriptional regulator with XRE-family HTH domain
LSSYFLLDLKLFLLYNEIQQIQGLEGGFCMTVGDRIKETRIKKDISQTDLADKCGISKQTLYKYENNIVTNIPLTTITTIAKALNVSEAYIMGWTSPQDAGNKDLALSNMSERIKEYALLLSQMPSDQQEHIISLIDMLNKNNK